MGRFFRLLQRVDPSNYSENTKVFLVVAGIVGVSAWRIFGDAPQKAGHDKFSSEKPQALRGETERSLEVERAKLAAAGAAAAPIAPAGGSGTAAAAPSQMR